MQNERAISFDILRIISTLAVIILHTAANQWANIPINTVDWQISNIYDSIVRWCVPMFVMLSGRIFLDTKKNISLSTIYRKYIKHIFAALVFWGLLYGFLALFLKSFLLKKSIEYLDIYNVFIKLILGLPWYHLWYLYLIIGIYMLTPLLRIFMQNAKQKDLEYLLMLFFSFGLLLPAINKYFLATSSQYKINFSITELSGFIGYYFAGYYFSKYVVTKSIKIFIYSMAVFSVLATITLTSRYSVSSGAPQDIFYGYLLPTTMFETYAVFLIFKNMKTQYFEKNKEFITYLANCSFGIYLVHDFINQFYKMLKIFPKVNLVLLIPIMSIITFFISFLIVSIIKKLPLLRYFV